MTGKRKLKESFHTRRLYWPFRRDRFWKFWKHQKRQIFTKTQFRNIQTADSVRIFSGSRLTIVGKKFIFNHPLFEKFQVVLIALFASSLTFQYHWFIIKVCFIDRLVLSAIGWDLEKILMIKTIFYIRISNKTSVVAWWINGFIIKVGLFSAFT